MTDSDARAIFDKLDSINAGLSDVAAKVAVLTSQMPDVRGRAEDHERRIRAMEARMWAMGGVLAFLVFAVPLAINLIQSL